MSRILKRLFFILILPSMLGSLTAYLDMSVCGIIFGPIWISSTVGYIFLLVRYILPRLDQKT